ncbi:MAG: hypothetical protein AAF790_07815 [Planctomycetota bacterium]
MGRLAGRLAVAATLCLAAAAPRLAAAESPPADRLLPATTTAFFSVANPDDLRAKWGRTQVGMLAADASMRPFVDQIRGKLIERFGNIEQRLGMTLDDVTAAAAGEVGVAMIHLTGERASVAVTIDATGKAAQADALLSKVDAQLIKRGAEKSSETYAGVQLAVYRLPKVGRLPAGRRVAVCRRGDTVLAVDSLKQARQMIDRLTGNVGAALADAKPYAETMRRCRAESRGLAPDVRWFVDPFAWDAARRTLVEGLRLADRKDTITVLGEQGFDAIRGVGGHISLAVDARQDIVHRTAIYAPPEGDAPGGSAREKYRLAMRMAQLPNRADMPVEAWAPRMTATYSTANLDIQNAFENVESLFDALSGHEGSFRSTMESFEIDPYGPEINIRDEVIAHLGSRITMMTDYTMPISPDCERYLFVVEVAKPDLLRSPIDKLMENDGAARREVNGVAYWEIVPEEETLTSGDGGLDDDLPSIDDTGADSDAGPRRDRVLRRAAVCLHRGQLIVASDVAFLEQVLFGVAPRESLAGSPDFQATMRQLEQLASPERCSWAFFRTDESIRPSYELVRRGLMPQSQTFFGRVLNELLTTKEDEEQGIVRKQRIDGSRLPTFELARRYFGPAARAIRTDADGWFITGVVLSKAGQ